MPHSFVTTTLVVLLTSLTTSAFHGGAGFFHRRPDQRPIQTTCRAGGGGSFSSGASASSFHKHVEKGQFAEREGKLDSAREHFLRAMLHRAAVGQEWVGQCEFQLANIQAERGDAASAVDLYKSSFDTWPELRECCDAHNNLGLALEECDRANEALEAYSAAISCEPWRCEPRGNLANILWEFGALEAAERELRTALELADVGPFKVKLLFNLETLLGEYEAKRADEAAAVHDLAVQLSPPELKTADAWHERDRVGTDDEQCVLFSTETTRCMEDEGL